MSVTVSVELGEAPFAYHTGDSVYRWVVDPRDHELYFVSQNESSEVTGCDAKCVSV
jgi:hypothetical protein